MNKEQFKNFKIKNIYCQTCKRTMAINNFSYSYIHLDGTASRCKVCDWFKRRNGAEIDGWNKEDVYRLVEFIIFEESQILNDIMIDIKNKTIEDIILGFQSLKIGNKKVKVKSDCKSCGNETLHSPSAYLKAENNYCSYECYWLDKPNTVGHGEDNKGYNRIKTNCTNCNKEIKVIPFDYNKKNEFGDNHNFCCQECYWEYRSKYYVGEKSIGANRIITKEQREKMKMTIIKNSRSSKRFDSKIQLTINNLLDNLNINYKREYIIKYYAMDNYLTDSNLIIEVMGDYWHTNPNKYNNQKYMINEMQAKGIHRDKIKHSYIKNHNNVEILYLWEYDIEHNLDICEKLILEYIHNNGKLINYNSFNYTMGKNNRLLLSESIIIPYQEMPVDKYRHLIKTKSA